MERAARRLVLLAVVALLLSGFQCRLLLLPGLVISVPAPGETVARSVWPVLQFDGALAPGAEQGVLLACGGAYVPSARHVLAPDRVVVNPQGELPADADCAVAAWTTGGPVEVPFRTAPAGTPFEARYDRRDRNLPLPFPDDFFLAPDPTTQTGLRPAIVVPDHAFAVQRLLDLLAATATPEADGWSPVGNLSVELGAAPDVSRLPPDADASLDPLAPVALFDLDPTSPTYGGRIPIEITPRSDTISGTTVHALVIFPGIPLEPGRRYGLVVSRRVLSATGEPLAPSPFFAAALGPAQGGEAPEVAALRPLIREVVEVAAASGPVPIPEDDVALAVRITARTIDTFAADLLAMREDVLALPPDVVVTGVTAEPAGLDTTALVRGTFQAPDWLGASAYLQRDAAGLPVSVGVRTVPFVLALPHGAAGAPMVMYQHGNPGSAESEVPSHARRYLAARGFAVAGFTDVLNRDFATVDDQQLALFGAVLSNGDVPDLYVQTYGEQLAFLQALRSLGALDVLPLGAPDGVADLDPTHLVYNGISYGSVHGQAFLPFAPELRAAALVVGAARVAELLEYQDRTRPTGGPAFLTELIPQFVPGATPRDLWMGVSLFALVYDPQDPHLYARFLFREPVAVDGTTAKASVLVVEGLDDTFTRNSSTRSLAWQLGPIPQLGVPLRRVRYLPLAAPPLAGNVDPATTAAMVQYAPEGLPDVPASPGCETQPEGHYCAQGASESLRADFFESAVTDPVPVLGGP